MNSAPLIFFAVLVIASPLSAAPNTLVRFPSEDASWKVEVTYSGPPEEVDAIRRAAVTQSGRIIRTEIEQMNGEKSETWAINDPPFSALRSATDDVLLVASSDSELSGDLIRSFGVELFQWIRDDLMVNEVSLQGKQCLLYESKPAADQAGPHMDAETGKPVPVEVPAHLRAWVDKATLLPVAYERGNMKAVFTFSPGPVQVLTLPASIRKELERQERLNSPPAHTQKG